MADYISINKYSVKNGELAISRKVFEDIAVEATNRVIGASVATKTKKIRISSPIKVIFKKNGQVGINVSISLSKGVKPTEISSQIQKEIAHDLAIYVESVPFEIEIDVVEIK